MRKRGAIAANALILLLFLGLVYAWSVFKKPLAALYGWSDTQLTWTFTICMSFFCIGGFLGAKLSQRFRPATLVRVCGGVIAAGFAWVAFADSLWQLYASYGVIVGCAIGVVYNVVLSTVGRWFPDKPGLLSGILLMGFGSGSLLFGPLATALLGRLGWKTTMLILGAAFLVVFFAAAFRVYPPAPAKNTLPQPVGKTVLATWEVSPSGMLASRNFWAYLVWCILICAIGLALVGQAFTIATAFSLESASAALLVGMVSVCNGLGRAIFGALYDRAGRVVTMLLITACPALGAAMLILALDTGNTTLLVAACLTISLGYGGAIPTNANFVRSYFGNRHYATNFSIVNFNILVSVLLGQFAGSGLYTRTGSYRAMAVAMFFMAGGAFVTCFFIQPAKAQEKGAAAKGIAGRQPSPGEGGGS